MTRALPKGWVAESDAGYAESDKVMASAEGNKPQHVPFLRALLAGVQDQKEAGVASWTQILTPEEEELLLDPPRTEGAGSRRTRKEQVLGPRDRFRRLFGLDLDWTNFPTVTVSRVFPATSGGGEDMSSTSSLVPSRAAQANLQVGDALLCCPGSAERVTLVAVGAGQDPEDAILRRIRDRISKERKTAQSFVFLRKDYLSRYAQVTLRAVEATSELNGISDWTYGTATRANAKCKIAALHGDNSSWASRCDLRVGDEVVGCDDMLVEAAGADWSRKVDEITNGKLVKNARLLILRSPPPGGAVKFSATTQQQEDDVRRALPPAWKAAIEERQRLDEEAEFEANQDPVEYYSKKTGEPGRFLWHLLAESKKLSDVGLYGWAMPKLEDRFLISEELLKTTTPRVRFNRLFGFDLDWTGFPYVKVSAVQEHTPRGLNPSRAAKNAVAVGDFLITCGGTADRISLAVSWPGEDPFDAILKRVAARKKQQKTPVCSML